MIEIDLRKILFVDKDSMRLEDNEKRLILIALIRTNFNAKEAYKLNCDGTYYTWYAYDKLWRKHFIYGMKNLKDNFKKQFGFREDKLGRLIKIEEQCPDKPLRKTSPSTQA